MKIYIIFYIISEILHCIVREISCGGPAWWELLQCHLRDNHI